MADASVHPADLNSILAVTGLVGGGIDAILAPLLTTLKQPRSTVERDAVLAALNGAMGDYLAATNSPLAIPMRLRRKGRPATGKLLLLVHDLCLNHRQWTRKGHNHGTALARALGFTPVHLHYNSGLRISTNGRTFADLIETLLDEWPAPLQEFAIVAHGLGGLVARSAYHYGTAARHQWPRRLGSLVFLGTPHVGAPLESIGNWVDAALRLSPYTSPLAHLGSVRSAAVTDLCYGDAVPLPTDVRCYAIAATEDGIVPVNSALGRHEDPARSLAFPNTHQWIGHNMNHWALLNRPTVYRQIAKWLA